MSETALEMPSDTASKETRKPRLPDGIDGRTRWARRYREIVDSFAADLGQPSGMQASLIARAATLSVELERADIEFAEGEGGDPERLVVYRQNLESLRRTLESLGLRQDGKPPARTINAVPPKMVQWGDFASANGIEDVDPDGGWTPPGDMDRDKYGLPRACLMMMFEGARDDFRGKAISEDVANVFRLLGFTPASFRNAYDARWPDEVGNRWTQ